MWHRAVHACEHAGCGLKHLDVHVGMGSVHAVRVGNAYCERSVEESGAIAFWPQGQRVILDGERGQTAGLEEGG